MERKTGLMQMVEGFLGIPVSDRGQKITPVEKGWSRDQKDHVIAENG